METLDGVTSKIDNQRGVVAAALARTDTLRAAILNKAFSGRLVPQNPADEPAGALLDRIRTARARFAPAHPRRNRPRPKVHA